MLDARNCHKTLFKLLTRNNNNCLRYLIPDMCDVIRQLLIVSDLQTNSQLFLQGLIGLKNSFICYAVANYQ